VSRPNRGPGRRQDRQFRRRAPPQLGRPGGNCWNSTSAVPARFDTCCWVALTEFFFARLDSSPRPAAPAPTACPTPPSVHCGTGRCWPQGVGASRPERTKNKAPKLLPYRRFEGSPLRRSLMRLDASRPRNRCSYVPCGRGERCCSRHIERGSRRSEPDDAIRRLRCLRPQ
jgi:hypothetical protein